MAYEPKVIKINDIEYVPKGDNEPAKKMDGLEYVIIRGENSGVFAGYLESKNKQEVILRNARRIWYWDGSASLSELAVNGTSKPENCKFPCEVKKIQILDVIEVIDCSKKAQESITNVPIWKN